MNRPASRPRRFAPYDRDVTIILSLPGVGRVGEAPTRYRIGVYGSGLTCRILRDDGLAHLTWLSGSEGFREFTRFRPEANILQVLPERKICGGTLEIDDDVAQTADIGAFRVS